jgi:flagellar basal-body rod protein FlgB
MSVTDLPLFSMLKTRMYWLNERQRVLAENVANADTPGFRGRDLKQLDFHEALRSAGATSEVKLATTAPGHIGGAGNTSRFPIDSRGGFETTPRGNAIVLEDEMMKVAQTQMDHQAATQLYSRSIGLIKTALGRR